MGCPVLESLSKALKARRLEKFSFPGCNAGVRFQDLTKDLSKPPGTNQFLGAKLGMRVFTAQRRKHDLPVSVRRAKVRHM
jgi:hypothetical protein